MKLTLSKLNMLLFSVLLRLENNFWVIYHKNRIIANFWTRNKPKFRHEIIYFHLLLGWCDEKLYKIIEFIIFRFSKSRSSSVENWSELLVFFLFNIFNIARILLGWKCWWRCGFNPIAPFQRKLALNILFARNNQQEEKFSVEIAGFEAFCG